ncbi:MAG: class I SAM-dependent methyltransferase [Patescibacteria group bacterium]
MEIEAIIPEYHSKNILVRKLFLKRLEIAIGLAQKKINLKNDLNIIDLGCGEGKLLKLLEERFKNIKIFGIDIEPSVIETENFLKAKIKIADIKDSGFPNNFFDIAFCLDVLEHFKDLEIPVREIKRILKPDGLLIVSVPVENWFYRLGRLIIKKTMSAERGPCSSPHFHNAKIVEDFLGFNGFEIVEKILLPAIPPLSLFHISSLRKNN